MQKIVQLTEGAELQLKKRAARSGIWTTLGFGFSQLLRLFANILVARFLFEEAFALSALVFAVLQGLAMFSDLGLGPSVVQNKRGSHPDFLNTAWTLQVARGAVLCVLALALAWPMAVAYSQNDPIAFQLIWLLPLAGVSLLLSGFNTPAIMLASRELTLGRLTLVEIVANFLGVCAMVYLAWKTREPYSLVMAAVIQAAVSLILGYVAFPKPKPRFCFDKESFWEIFRFGKWLFVSTLLTFLALQLDKFAFSAVYSFDLVGVYTISASFVAIAPMFLGKIQLAVAFPLYSRLGAESDDFVDSFKRLRFVVLAAGSFLAACMIGLGESFVSIAYDDRYTAAGGLISVLALSAWFVVVEGVYGAVFLARGEAHWVVLTNATKVVAFIVLFLIVSHQQSLILGAVAVVLADLVKSVAALIVAKRMGIRGGVPESLWFLYLVGTGVAVLFAGRWLQSSLSFDLVPAFLIQGCLLVLAFLPFSVPVLRTVRSRFLK